MDWFQLDTDMPDDPRIREVITRMGNEGLGGLVRIWCFVGNHGIRPGISLDRNRRPLQKQALIDASGLPKQKFSDLMAILGENGHIKKNRFLKQGVIVIPAMASRASNYEKRRVRTLDAHSTANRRQQNKTKQDNKDTRASARGSLRSPGPNSGHNPRTGAHCAHEPRCATFTDCIQRTITEARAERERHAGKRT